MVSFVVEKQLVWSGFLPGMLRPSFFLPTCTNFPVVSYPLAP
jgi:hypothetical protein